MDDELAMQNRMEAVKATFRASRGGLSAEEITRHGTDPQTARSIKAAMDRQADEPMEPESSVESSGYSVTAR